jgi:hypothetical protein
MEGNETTISCPRSTFFGEVSVDELDCAETGRVREIKNPTRMIDRIIGDVSKSEENIIIGLRTTGRTIATGGLGQAPSQDEVANKSE